MWLMTTALALVVWWRPGALELAKQANKRVTHAYALQKSVSVCTVCSMYVYMLVLYYSVLVLS